jgi:hypothetical protein
MTPSPRNPKRWALIVGIDEYLHLPHARLYGCVNDAKQMAWVLMDRFDFPRETMTVLLNEQATRGAIRGAMEELADRVRQDDVVVFHFSGHGSQMRDREGDERDEPDGLDETLLTHDTGRVDHENRDVTDDEIYEWLLRLTAVTPYVTLVCDCCHSGTVSREDKVVRVREVEPDLRPVGELPPSPFRRLRDLKEKMGAKGPSGWLPPSERYTLIAACRNKEKANEVVFRGSTQGALTYHLVRELREAPAGTTYRELLDPVIRRVSEEFPQHPQLEGAGDRELFGLTWIDYPRFVRIGGLDGGLALLAGGAAAGILPGSLWTVHEAGIRTTEEAAPLGRLQVTEVRAATSDAVAVGDLKWDLDKPKWAVEESGCFDRHLVVAVQVPAGWEAKGEEMARQVDSSAVLRRVPGAVAEATVTLVPPRQRVEPEDPASGLGPLAEAAWVVVEPGGEIALPPFRVDGEATARRVMQNLEKKARFRNALELKNPGSTLAGQVDLLVRRRGSNGRWVELDDALGKGIQEGEAVSFEIVNRHESELFVYLLDFGLSAQIQLLHPLAGSRDPLEGGHTVPIGAAKGRELEPCLPEVFPFDASANGLRRDHGVSTLKLFACTHSLDLRLLEQRGYRADQRPKTAPAPPALKPRLFVQREGGEDWTTVERPVVLRRR